MKFLIISQYAGAPDYGMVLRNYNWGKALVDKGHNVTIVASAFSHYRASHPDKPKTEIIDGVKFGWLWGPKYGGKNNVMRLFSMVIFCIQLLFTARIRDERFDVVITSSPHPFQIFSGRFIAKRKKAKLIYDIRDLWPLTPMHLGGYSKKHPLIRFMSCAEKYACKYADIVTSVPEAADSYLIQQGMAQEKFLAVGNGFTESTQGNEDLNPKHIDRLKDLKTRCDVLITHTGAMGRANALHILLESLVELPQNIGCVLLGNGPNEEDLKQIVKEKNLQDRVLFLEPIPLNQMQSFLSHIDIGYCGLLESPLYQYGASPTKLNDYMLAKKPILYAAGYKGSSVEVSGGGVIAEPENIDDIAVKIGAMAGVPEAERQAMGQKGYEWAIANHNVSAQMDKLLEKLGE